MAAEIGVRTALTRRDAGLAARRLSAAGEAQPDQGAMHAGTLIALRLLVQGALGDHARARTAASGLALMRRLHAPLAAQEMRLAHLEALIDAGAGTGGGMSAQARAGPRLPVRPRAPPPHRTRDGPEAPPERRRRDAPADGEGTVETTAVVRILQQCHEAQSDADAVTGVCQSVRTALGAAPSPRSR